jgi:hypothetical protein
VTGSSHPLNRGLGGYFSPSGLVKHVRNIRIRFSGMGPWKI